MTSSWPVRVVVVAALAGVATGCGGGDKSGGDDFAQQPAADIFAAAKRDMTALDTVKYFGQISSGGDAIHLDIQVGSDGDCAGRIGLGGGSATVVATGGTTWFRPDAAFWRQQAPDQADAIIAAVGDKWVVDSNREFAQFCDLDQFFDQVFTSEDDTSTYKTLGTDEIDGKLVVEVTNTGPHGGSTGSVLVDDPHYLVRVERTEGDQPGKIDFSDFNTTFHVQAPADDQVVDLSKQ